MTTRDETEQQEAAKVQEAAGAASVDQVKGAHERGELGSYTVQPGDTLASIGDAVYGTEDAAAFIHEANQGQAMSTDPKILEPGTVLVLPTAPAAPADAAASDVPAPAPAPAGEPTPAPAVAVTGAPDPRDAELEQLRADNEALRRERSAPPPA